MKKKWSNTSVQTATKKGLLDSSVMIGVTLQLTDVWSGCIIVIEDELDSIFENSLCWGQIILSRVKAMNIYNFFVINNNLRYIKM